MKPFTRHVPDPKPVEIAKLRYYHVSRPLMRDPHGRVDFAYVEMPNPLVKGAVVRRHLKGKTLNVGSNAAKRADRRAHIRARVQARKDRVQG